MRLIVHTLPRLVVYALLALGLLAGAAVLGLRYWLLPNIEQYRSEITAAVSRATGTKVTIGAIQADWNGLRPRLQMDRVLVFDAQGGQALELVRVDATLSWRSALTGSLNLNKLEVVQPSLEVKRDRAGQLFVAGMPIGDKRDGGGFGNLLLDARTLVIRDAVLSWEDEASGAPPLVLDGVSLQLENRGSRHRFGFKATPPARLAGLIDVRGDLAGATLSDLPAWSGTVYTELPYADGGAWRSYVPLPATFRGGRGGIRLWLEFHGRRVDSLVADVKLSDTVARLNETLPELDLVSLAGRLSYRAVGEGFEVSSDKLAFMTRGDTRVGSTDFLFRTEPQQKDRPARGEFRANQLELAAWASLTGYLPLDAAFKEKIAQFAPSGRVNDFALRWTGPLEAPDRYSLSGRIERGAMKAVGNFPGVGGLNGVIEADEASGKVSIFRMAEIDLPHVFNAALPLDAFTAQLKWKRDGDRTDFAFREVAFATPHLAGTAAGSYRAIPGQAGVIDLGAHLSRFDAGQFPAYLPRMLGPNTRDWVTRAVVGAKSRDATLRLAGDLKDFPFVDGKAGEFLVRAALTDGVLDYAPSWPRIENIRADLVFRGRSMEIKASEAGILGTKLKDVVATVANLAAPDPMLEVHGEASGPLAEKLRFIAQSPVRNQVGSFTDGIVGGGNGKLLLKLHMPLNDSKSTRVEGDYQFINASLDLGGGAPTLSDVNGRMQFTESGVKAQNISARTLGGPVVIGVATQPNAEVAVDARGTATMEAVRALAGDALLRRVSGQADWQAKMILRKGASDLRITSPLTAVAADFPAPLRKVAGQNLSLTLERRLSQGKPEWVRASLGDGVSVELERILAPGEPPRFKRGTISFNRPAALPAQDGLWVAGELRTLDIDRWRQILKEQAGAGELAMAGIDLTLSSINLFDRPFTNVHVVAATDAGNWQGSLGGREVAGDFSWRPGGKGLFYARLKRLIIPAEAGAANTGGVPAGDDTTASVAEFPAMDIVADELQIKNRKFGRLELKAEQQGRDWRIERLQLMEAEATLEADGLWSRGARPQTDLKLKLTAQDAGKLLDELGFPNSVKRGKADLSGNLSWPGAPFDMLPANLSGKLRLEAKTGQFLKAEPGAGRLLGLMSLQSLPRRISLDFRDIFSDGFAFDEIRGDVAIRQGLLTTRDFAINGPSAKVEMSGEVNLARETQQLNVKVIPSVGEGVSLASALLGGPVVGVTALVLQKVLKDPINRAVAYEYSVTGTWDNPSVVKAEKKPLADETRQP